MALADRPIQRLCRPRVEYGAVDHDRVTLDRDRDLVEKTRVHVFSVAKTVADCFKYRNKIGLDVAVEALQEVVRKRKAAPAEIMGYARIVRIESVIDPYLRALL